MAQDLERSPAGESPPDIPLEGKEPPATHAALPGRELEPNKVILASPAPTVPRDDLAEENGRGLDLGRILMTAVLSLVCGGLGAWAYETYLHKAPMPPSTSSAVHSTPSVAGAANDSASSMPAGAARVPVKAVSPDEVDKLAKEVDGLTDRFDRLREQVSTLPKPGPPADLKEVQSRLADLEKDQARHLTLEDRLTVLDDRISALERMRDSLRTDAITGSPPPLGSGPALASLATAPSGDRPTPPKVGDDADQTALSQGIELFRAGRYKEALTAFQRRGSEDPSDARLWYFEALANGLSTGQWGGETERLVLRGVERERAGTPRASQIDAAFAGLTTPTGKDWLAGYRRRAARR